jgi:hypothetical protein
MWMKSLVNNVTNELDTDYDGESWFAFPIPAGKRVLVATKINTTLVISSDSIVSCNTKLSGGSEQTVSKNSCWLDCI